jgi:SAM-dependent methyltransferase
MSQNSSNCLICGEISGYIGQVKGKIPPFNYFSLFHCPNCHFTFIPDYRTDYETIYSADYYQGRGADPLVRYAFDHQEPGVTLRQYEWRGLTSLFQGLFKDSPLQANWLDYGCGLGSLARYGRDRGINIFGYEPYGSQNETNSPKEEDKAYILSAQDLATHRFDFITAIEVIEHTADPLAFLADIRSHMNPGGILFLTTGNAKPFRAKLTRWSYTSCPDVHISFFEPETLAMAMSKTGFRPVFKGYLPGFNDIIKYKILKNLKFTKRSLFFDFWPWLIISRLADAIYQVTAMPIGVAE